MSKGRTWLVIDVSNIAYAAYYTMGDLSHDGEMTGVIFGVFKQIESLQDLYAPDGLVFCFDGGVSERRKIYDDYKESRWERWKEMTQEERQSHNDLRTQLKALYKKHLPQAGFKNVFRQKGYEADDVIASVCLFSVELMTRNDEAIIASTDNDLLQLLSNRVSVCNPRSKTITTKESFVKQWGIDPVLWADVKAIAGCDSDDVKGVKGVGEKTAAKFLRGVLKSETQKFRDIVKYNRRYKKNLKVVRLPLPGTNKFDLREDRVTPKRWNKVMRRLGMKSILRR